MHTCWIKKIQGEMLKQFSLFPPKMKQGIPESKGTRFIIIIIIKCMYIWMFICTLDICYKYLTKVIYLLTCDKELTTLKLTRVYIMNYIDFIWPSTVNYYNNG